MTRQEAELQVSGRWERLGLDKIKTPIMFGLDVDNMLEENNSQTGESTLEMERRTR